jgi:hypothetical protein
LAEGCLSIVKDKDWGNASQSYLLKAKILNNIIYYLSAQYQDNLPYHVPGVDSNDRIFIGNDDFKRECAQMMDYCFD